MDLIIATLLTTLKKPDMLINRLIGPQTAQGGGNRPQPPGAAAGAGPRCLKGDPSGTRDNQNGCYRVRGARTLL